MGYIPTFSLPCPSEGQYDLDRRKLRQYESSLGHAASAEGKATSAQIYPSFTLQTPIHGRVSLEKRGSNEGETHYT